MKSQQADIAALVRSSGKMLFASAELNFLLINEKQIVSFVNAINSANKIGIYGAGRSGEMGNAFTRRLKHLGYSVFFVGEPAAEPLDKEGLLVVISGGGETPTSEALASVAKELKTNVAVITAKTDSPIGKKADIIVHVSGREELTKNKEYLARAIAGENIVDNAPLKTIFEITVLFFLEAVIAALIKIKNISEKEITARHVKIE